MIVPRELGIPTGLRNRGVGAGGWRAPLVTSPGLEFRQLPSAVVQGSHEVGDRDVGGCSVPRGRGIFEDPARPAKQQQLGQELKELMNAERTLDQLIQSCSLSFKHLTEDNANKKYPFCGEGGGSGSRAAGCPSVYSVDFLFFFLTFVQGLAPSRGQSHLYLPLQLREVWGLVWVFFFCGILPRRFRYCAWSPLHMVIRPTVCVWMQSRLTLIYFLVMLFLFIK